MISFLTPVVSDIGNLLSKDQYGIWTSLTVPNLVTGILKLAFILATVIFFAQFLHGAINWIISAGNAEQLQKAQKELTSALIGLVIIFSTWAILNLVNYFFGLETMKSTGGSASQPAQTDSSNCKDVCMEVSCASRADCWEYKSFCYKNCRCQADGQHNMWYLDQPWTEGNTSYVCSNGVKTKK